MAASTQEVLTTAHREARSGAQRRRPRAGVGRHLTRTLGAALTVLVLGAAALGAAPARAAQIGIVNGSFEQQDFNGWTTTGQVLLMRTDLPATNEYELKEQELCPSFPCAGLNHLVTSPLDSTAALSQQFIAPSAPTELTLYFVGLLGTACQDVSAPRVVMSASVTLTDATSGHVTKVSYSCDVIDAVRTPQFLLSPLHSYTLTIQCTSIGGNELIIDNVGISSLSTVPLNRYYDPAGWHWVTTGAVTPTYQLEQTLGSLATAAGLPSTAMTPIYGCLHGTSDHFLSRSATCEGWTVLGREGYAFNGDLAGGVEIYRCWTGHDHFVSTDPNCEGTTTEFPLGRVAAP
jgi:hypothetical protein